MASQQILWAGPSRRDRHARGVTSPSSVRPPDLSFANLGFGILVVVGFVAIQFLCLMPVMIYGLVAGGGVDGLLELAMNPWVLGTVNVLSASIVLSLALRGTGEPPAQFFAIRPVSLRLVPPAVITAVGLGVVLDQIDTVLVDVFARLSLKIEDPLHVGIFAASPIGTALTLVVVAPLTEEYLMRGLVLRGLLRRYAPRIAILISAILFGLMHANLRQFIVGLVVGGAFGWWYYRTASVALPLLGHAIFNLLPTLFILFPEAGLPFGHYAADGSVVYQPWWVTLGGALAVAVGLNWFETIADLLPRPAFDPVPAPEPPLLVEEPPLLASSGAETAPHA